MALSQLLHSPVPCSKIRQGTGVFLLMRLAVVDARLTGDVVDPAAAADEKGDVFDLIAGSDGPYSIREMKAKEAFGPGELEAFARLPACGS